MAIDPEALSDREKAVLRLLAQGFDAKSAALELGLSVHTVNERLRSARRKLQVTSSREAARLLFGSERRDPKNLVYKELGVAHGASADEGRTQESNGVRARRTPALIAGGFVAMSLITLAAFLTLSPTRPADLGPLPNWSLAAELPGELSKPANELHLDVDRSLWNGQEASDIQISEYLSLIKQLNPQPLTILSYGVGVSPERIQRVRTRIDNALSCEPATCLEVSQPRP